MAAVAAAGEPTEAGELGASGAAATAVAQPSARADEPMLQARPRWRLPFLSQQTQAQPASEAARRQRRQRWV